MSRGLTTRPGRLLDRQTSASAQANEHSAMTRLKALNFLVLSSLNCPGGMADAVDDLLRVSGSPEETRAPRAAAPQPQQLQQRECAENATADALERLKAACHRTLCDAGKGAESVEVMSEARDLLATARKAFGSERAKHALWVGALETWCVLLFVLLGCVVIQFECLRA